METISKNEFSTSKAIRRFAKRNYETYKLHYQERNLVPVSLDDFLKNYSS